MTFKHCIHGPDERKPLEDNRTTYNIYFVFVDLALNYFMMIS